MIILSLATGLPDFTIVNVVIAAEFVLQLSKSISK
jgi:hypothetical protein